MNGQTMEFRVVTSADMRGVDEATAAMARMEGQAGEARSKVGEFERSMEELQRRFYSGAIDNGEFKRLKADIIAAKEAAEEATFLGTNAERMAAPAFAKGKKQHALEYEQLMGAPEPANVQPGQGSNEDKSAVPGVNPKAISETEQLIARLTSAVGAYLEKLSVVGLAVRTVTSAWSTMLEHNEKLATSWDNVKGALSGFVNEAWAGGVKQILGDGDGLKNVFDKITIALGGQTEEMKKSLKPMSDLIGLHELAKTTVEALGEAFAQEKEKLSEFIAESEGLSKVKDKLDELDKIPDAKAKAGEMQAIDGADMPESEKLRQKAEVEEKYHEKSVQRDTEKRTRTLEGSKEAVAASQTELESAEKLKANLDSQIQAHDEVVLAKEKLAKAERELAEQRAKEDELAGRVKNELGLENPAESALWRDEHAKTQALGKKRVEAADYLAGARLDAKEVGADGPGFDGAKTKEAQEKAAAEVKRLESERNKKVQAYGQASEMVGVEQQIADAKSEDERAKIQKKKDEAGDKAVKEAEGGGLSQAKELQNLGKLAVGEKPDHSAGPIGANETNGPVKVEVVNGGRSESKAKDGKSSSGRSSNEKGDSDDGTDDGFDKMVDETNAGIDLDKKWKEEDRRKKAHDEEEADKDAAAKEKKDKRDAHHKEARDKNQEAIDQAGAGEKDQQKGVGGDKPPGESDSYIQANIHNIVANQGVMTGLGYRAMKPGESTQATIDHAQGSSGDEQAKALKEQMDKVHESGEKANKDVEVTLNSHLSALGLVAVRNQVLSRMMKNQHRRVNAMTQRWKDDQDNPLATY